MRRRRPLSLGSLIALAVLVTGLAAALNPTKAGEVWDSFVETLVTIAWACVGVFL
jgi:hypothetical protein